MSAVPRKTRALVLARARYHCERCGVLLAADYYSLQHRRPRGMGGSSDPDIHSPSNLLALCGSAVTGCHGWAESKRDEADAAGFLIKGRRDPAEVPVLLLMRKPVLLLPDGTYGAAA